MRPKGLEPLTFWLGAWWAALTLYFRRLYWEYRPTRCECGYVIWPWHLRLYDGDLGAYIHASCAGDPNVAACPSCSAELSTFGRAELLHNLDGSHTIEYSA